MSLLAALIQRGGQPAAVKPTMALRPDEKEYASFLVDVEEYHSAEVDLSSGIFASDGLFFPGLDAEAGAEEGWQPQSRQGIVVTTRRIVLGTDYEFRDLITIQRTSRSPSSSRAPTRSASAAPGSRG
jgi:hypothetical protein